eukprot:g9891.t1
MRRKPRGSPPPSVLEAAIASRRRGEDPPPADSGHGKEPLLRVLPEGWSARQEASCADATPPCPQPLRLCSRTHARRVRKRGFLGPSPAHDPAGGDGGPVARPRSAGSSAAGWRAAASGDMHGDVLLVRGGGASWFGRSDYDEFPPDFDYGDGDNDDDDNGGGGGEDGGGSTAFCWPEDEEEPAAPPPPPPEKGRRDESISISSSLDLKDFLEEEDALMKAEEVDQEEEHEQGRRSGRPAGRQKKALSSAGFGQGGAGAAEGGRAGGEVGGGGGQVEGATAVTEEAVGVQQAKIQALEDQLAYLEEDRRRVLLAAKEARSNRRKDDRQLKEYVQTLEVHLDQLSKEKQDSETAMVERVREETAKALEQAQQDNQAAAVKIAEEVTRARSELEATQVLLEEAVQAKEAAVQEKAAGYALLRTEQGKGAAEAAVAEAVAAAREEATTKCREEMEAALAEEKEKLRKQMEARVATMRAGLKRRLQEARAERAGAASVASSERVAGGAGSGSSSSTNSGSAGSRPR